MVVVVVVEAMGDHPPPHRLFPRKWWVLRIHIILIIRITLTITIIMAIIIIAIINNNIISHRCHPPIHPRLRQPLPLLRNPFVIPIVINSNINNNSNPIMVEHNNKEEVLLPRLFEVDHR